MKAPLNWLKDYINLEEDINVLCEALTFAGIEVLSLNKSDSDVLFELEITPNRVDLLSIYGICRELSCILNKNLKKIQPPSYTKKINVDIKVQNFSDCPFYTLRIFEDVKVTESPSFIKDRLSKMGLNSINNVVDITNFCLFELGQPLHAFDLDKLKLPLIVRRASHGERLLALDNKEYELNPEILVIADSQKPVAIAGVIGGLETCVTPQTKRILLESAYFNPILVRRAKRLLGIETESSYRFERGVIPYYVDFASRRCSHLFEKFCSAKFKGFKSVGRLKISHKKIPLDIDLLNKRLDLNLKKSEVSKILKRLKFKFTQKNNKIYVYTPEFRKDINIPEDLTEEVARIYGYKNIKDRIPSKEPSIEKKDFFEFKQNIKNILIEKGFYELITFSLTSEKTLKDLGIFSENLIKLINPLSQKYVFLRNSLLAGLLERASFNLNQYAESIRFFETAHIYYKEEKNIKEEEVIGILLGGKKSFYWKDKDKNFDYFDLKGIVIYLLTKLGIKNIDFKEKEFPFFEFGAQILFKKESLGFIGKLSKKVLKSLDINNIEIFYSELSLEKLFSNYNDKKEFIPFSKFPFTFRDISFIIDEKIKFEEIKKVLFERKEKELIKEIRLLEIYKGKEIPENKKSLLLRIFFQSFSRTLSSEEIEEIVLKMKEDLKEKFSAQIR